jgi:hypothetical protein
MSFGIESRAQQSACAAIKRRVEMRPWDPSATDNFASHERESFSGMSEWERDKKIKISNVDVMWSRDGNGKKEEEAKELFVVWCKIFKWADLCGEMHSHHCSSLTTFMWLLKCCVTIKWFFASHF